MIPEVSVIIVNWNGREDLAECLHGLRDQTFHGFETIVVDNGSSDGSAPYLKDNFPEVKIVALDENRGFAGGNMAGIGLASGRYVALLNNDTLPDPMWLSHLVKAMEEYPDAGICASRIMVWDKEILDGAGDIYTTAGVALKRGSGLSPDGFMHKEYLFGACAGAVLYRKSMIEEIGFFDPDYFIVNEDTDLSFRAQLAGWRCLYVPEAVVRHKVSMTRRKRKDLLVYYKVRNADYVWIKNLPGPLILRYLHHILIGQIAFLVKFALVQRQWKAFLKAKKDVIRNLSRLIRKRNALQKKRRVSNAYLKSIMKSPFSREVLYEYLMPLKRGK